MRGVCVFVFVRVDEGRGIRQYLFSEKRTQHKPAALNKKF
jgi:hypothetical protein